MKDKLTNLFSRKFIMTALTTIIGLATLITNMDDPKIQIVALIVVLVAQVTYNVIEGNIDAKSVVSQAAATMTKINDILDAIPDEEQTTAEGITDTQATLDAVKKTTEAGE